jgi:hypothetical protein
LIYYENTSTIQAIRDQVAMISNLPNLQVKRREALGRRDWDWENTPVGPAISGWIVWRGTK